MTIGSLLGDRVLVAPPDVAAELRPENGLRGLTALREDWQALTPLLREARFYHQHAWHLAYLQHLERDVSAVRFFAFYRDGRPIAMFPLRQVLRTVAGVQLRVWEIPCDAHMDLCDVLIARDIDSAAVLCDLVRSLTRTADLPWDALHLPKLLDGSIAMRALQAAPLSFVHLVRRDCSMHFDCSSLDAALRDANPQFLRNLRRQRRKLGSRGRIDVSLVREPAELDGALAEFLRVEASGWKGPRGSRSAIMLHRDVEAFYRQLTRHFGAERRCSINLLKLDGKTIAAQYALIDGRRMNLLKIAYDEAYAAEAPGSGLLHDVLARCCESREFAELSLVSGPDWAAGRWNPQATDVWSGYVFNASPRGIAAYLATRMKPFVAGARAFLASRD